MKEQCRFWFVHARVKDGMDVVNLAVAAFTQRSARVQARKRLGPHFTIEEPSAIIYADAWVLDHGWQRGIGTGRDA